jgi:hypothetical protein
MKPIKTAAQWEPEQTGIYTGLTMQTYLQAPGASRSLLARVAARPSTGLQMEAGSSDAQAWGTLLNDLLLFGTRDYYVRPDVYETGDRKPETGKPETKPWNGNAGVCKEWLRAHRDRPVIRAKGEHSAEWLDKAAAKALADPRVRELLKVCAHKEVSIFARHEEYHFLLKGRPDLLGVFPDGRVVYADIKTTTDASTRNFSREILKWGYHKQFALGREILHRLGYSPFEGFLIIVEKGDEPRVQVRKLAERAMDKGDLDLDDELKIYGQCRVSGKWPDFPDEMEPHITGVIDLPEGCYKGDLGLEGMTVADVEDAAAEPAGTLNA